jgi:hypothetical protein
LQNVNALSRSGGDLKGIEQLNSITWNPQFASCKVVLSGENQQHGINVEPVEEPCYSKNKNLDGEVCRLLKETSGKTLPQEPMLPPFSKN